MRQFSSFHMGCLWAAILAALSALAALAAWAVAAQEERVFTLLQAEKRIGTERYTIAEHPEERSVAVEAEARIELPYRSVEMKQRLLVDPGTFSLKDYTLHATVGGQAQTIRASRAGDSVIVELSASGADLRRALHASGEVLVLDNMLANHLSLLAMRSAGGGFRPETLQVIVPQVGALLTALVLPGDPEPDGSRSIEIRIASVIEILRVDPSGEISAIEIPSQGFSYTRGEDPVAEILEPRPAPPRIERESVPEGPGGPARALFEERPVDVPSGGIVLGGTLALPRGGQTIPYPSVLFVHGSGPQDRDETIGPNRPFRELARGLAVFGIASLRYDKRTLVAPETTPPLEVTVQEEVIDDALAALQVLRSQMGIDSRRIWIVGHSLGGCLAPAIARADGGVAGLVILAGSLRPLDLILRDQIVYLGDLARREEIATPSQETGLRLLLAQLDSVAAGHIPPARLILGMSGRYLSDYRSRDLPEDFAAFRGPVLIMRGTKDYQVTALDVESWRDAALRGGKTNVKIIERPDLGHLFIPIKGDPTPASLMARGSVDPGVIQEIADFVSNPR